MSKPSGPSSIPNEEEESIVASLDSVSLRKDSGGQLGFEQELLMSIQAVSIGPSETSSALLPDRTTTPNPELDSRNPFMTVSSDDNHMPSQLLDLYADLVNGGASLSLEDSSATIFDSQVLIDALQSVTEEIHAGASIDQLARDLGDSLLDCALPMSMLNMDDIHISDLVPFSPSPPDLENESTASTKNPQREQEKAEETVPIPRVGK
jgi:hypothetical protein